MSERQLFDVWLRDILGRRRIVQLLAEDEDEARHAARLYNEHVLDVVGREPPLYESELPPEKVV